MQGPGAAAAGLGGRNLFTYDVRTGAVTQGTSLSRPSPGSPRSFLNTFDIADRAWAPDGAHILVAANVGGIENLKPSPCGSNLRSYELLLVTPAGGLDRWLTCTQGSGATGQVLNQEPAWTLDGQTVLFRRATSTTLQGDLYAVRSGDPVDPATGVPTRTRLTATDPATELAPTVAPDQATVAFASDRTGVFHLYTLSRAGALPATDYAATCLTCGNPLGIVEAGDPAWSPGLP